jgi:hypothetical protein
MLHLRLPLFLLPLSLGFLLLLLQLLFCLLDKVVVLIWEMIRDSFVQASLLLRRQWQALDLQTPRIPPAAQAVLIGHFSRLSRYWGSLKSRSCRFNWFLTSSLCAACSGVSSYSGSYVVSPSCLVGSSDQSISPSKASMFCYCCCC